MTYLLNLMMSTTIRRIITNPNTDPIIIPTKKRNRYRYSDILYYI